MTSHPSETRPFPVVHSVLSASALATGLLPDYAIGAVTGCKLLHHNLNDLYLVTTADAP